MRSLTLVATSICLGLLLGVSPAHSNQLVTATLKNGSYGTGTAVAPTTGVVNAADGVVFVATEANGRSNGLVNWQIGNNSQWRRTGTITFLIRASRASVSASGGQIVNDNYGFGTFNNGQSTFAIAGGPVLNGPGTADDRLRITWNTWHNNVWYAHNTVDLEFDKWYSIGFVWGRPGTQFEVWLNQQLVSAQNVSGLAFPWGSDGLQSGFNMGFGDNHERGVSGYESIAGVKFADVRMWNEVRPFGDTVVPNSSPVGTADAYSVNEDGVLDVPFPGVLANDTDADNDGLTASLNVSPTHGALALAPTGAFTYTPNAGYNGSDSFKYMVSDLVSTSGPITVSITVNPVNDAPVANADSATTAEDTPIVIDVLANDTDADNDSLIVTQAAASSGSVSFDGGQFTFTPAPDANGIVQVSYSISDGHGGTAQGTVTITVTPVNDAPLGVDDQAQTTEDAIGLDIDVLGNDIDVDGDVLQVTAASGTNGTVVFDSSHVGFVPAPNFHGTATISYTLTDGHGESSHAAVTITVTPINDDPVATGDSASTSEDTAITVDVVANDSDVDGDAITITGATASAGSVSAGGGSVTFTPDANFHGNVSITYTITDGHGGSATGSLSITVTAANDGPSAAPDSATTNEDSAVTIDVLANDSDLDGDSLTITGATASVGSVAVVPGGLLFTPPANYHGGASINYAISDGNGGTASAAVAVSVASVNDAPTTSDASASTTGTAPVSFTLTAADVDGDSVGFSVSAPAHGSLTGSSPSFTYTAGAGFSGTETLSFVASDGHGGEAPGIITIVVQAPVNRSPIALDDAATATDGAAVTIAVLANDVDPDGDLLAITGATGAGRGTTSIVAGGVRYRAQVLGLLEQAIRTLDGLSHKERANLLKRLQRVERAKARGRIEVAKRRLENMARALERFARHDEHIRERKAQGKKVNKWWDHDCIDPAGAARLIGEIRGLAAGTLTDQFTYSVSDGHGGTASAVVVVTIKL